MLTFSDTNLDRSPICGMLLSDKSRCCRAVQQMICSMAYHKKIIILIHAHTIKKKKELFPSFSQLILLPPLLITGRTGGGLSKTKKKQC